jgi:hypothetical protein
MDRSTEAGVKEMPSTGFSADQIRKSVTGQLRATELNTSPTPYIFVRDIFPADFYTAIQEHFPPESIFRSKDPRRTGNQRALLYRKNVNLAQDMDAFESRSRPYWNLMREVIDHRDFIQAVFQKFAEPMRGRYGRDSLDVRIRLEVFRDLAGYAIGPHTDAPHKVFTGLFYLPPDNSQQDLGTSLFAPKQPGLAEDSGRQFPFELFEEKARMPFSPNCMFMFMKTHTSFHGRHEIPETNRTRNWMNCSLQLADRFIE